MFELPLTSAADGPAVLQVQHAYGVTVAFKQRPRAFVTTVIVRGSVNSCTAVKEATSLLMKHLTSNPAVRAEGTALCLTMSSYISNCWLSD